MSKFDGNNTQYLEMSPNDLRLQLSVCAKNLLHIRMSQISAKRRGEASKQRRQIARLLTQLRSIDA